MWCENVDRGWQGCDGPSRTAPRVHPPNEQVPQPSSAMQPRRCGGGGDCATAGVIPAPPPLPNPSFPLPETKGRGAGDRRRASKPPPLHRMPPPQRLHNVRVSHSSSSWGPGLLWSELLDPLCTRCQRLRDLRRHQSPRALPRDRRRPAQRGIRPVLSFPHQRQRAPSESQSGMPG